jgi:phospholipid/cholesterol/gamma-HCH transport system substrate-binding protein
VTGKYIKVGVAVIIIAVASFFLLRMLSKGIGGEASQFKHYYAFFKDATGLVDRSNVQVAGLNVGEIMSREVDTKIWTDEQGIEHRQVLAKIWVKVQKKYAQVYDNAIIYKKQSSLLGGYYLEIDPGSKEAVAKGGKLEKHQLIPDKGQITNVQEVTSMGDLMTQFQDLIPILKKILEDVRLMTSGPIQQSAERVREILDQNSELIHGVMKNIDRIAGDVSGITGRSREDVVATVRNIRNITESLKAFTGGGGGADGGQLQATTKSVQNSLDKLRTAIDKLDKGLGNVVTMTDTAKKGELVENINKSAEHIEEITREGGDFVKGITRLKTIVSLRSEFNFYSQTLKTYLGVELRPRPDKYYLIELIDDPRGSVKRTRTITQSTDPNKPPYWTEDKTEISEAFRFSFMLGKRIDWVGFRFGVKESTGGGGVDFYLWQDRFMVSADLFDFRSNTYPRFKVLGAWEFFRYMYVVGGVDDIFNQDSRKGTGGGRDYFVGAQLRFNDEDLKTLLMFGGSAVASTATK